jgi:hypothetical protein
MNQTRRRPRRKGCWLSLMRQRFQPRGWGSFFAGVKFEGREGLVSQPCYLFSHEKQEEGQTDCIQLLLLPQHRHHTRNA